MKCPLCQFEGAYVGLHDVECINMSCPKFSPKQYQIVQEESRKQILEDAKEEVTEKIYFTAEWKDSWEDNGDC